MFLAQAEVEELTGYKRSAEQSRWLWEHGITNYVNRQGTSPVHPTIQEEGMRDYAAILRSYVPNGDGYNGEFAQDLSEAADEIERLRLVEEQYNELKAAAWDVEKAFLHNEGSMDRAIDTLSDVLQEQDGK